MDFNNNFLKYQYEVLKLFYVLAKQGFTISEALPIVIKRYPNLDWINRFEQGNSFDQILSDEHFDPDAILVFSLSIRSSSVEEALRQSLLIIDSKLRKRQEFLEIIKYPIMLIGISTAAIIFVVVFLIPQFTAILQSMDAYDGGVLIVFAIFHIMPFVLFVVIILCFCISLYIYKLDSYRRFKLFIRFRVTKNMYLALYNQVFILNLTNLMRTNMHLSDVLELLANQKQNYILASECQKIVNGLSCGDLMSDSLTKDYYQPELIELIKQGELTGMLMYNIATYNEMLQLQNEEKTKRFLFLIQPIFYSLFGILILALYAAIFIPMFKLMDSI